MRQLRIEKQSINRCVVLAITTLLLVTLTLNNLGLANEIEDPDPLRFSKNIKKFAWQDAKNRYPTKPLLFIGSSSIYMWKTADAFPDKAIINRGLSGAHISDINYFYPSIVAPYSPAKVLFYCGDNDIAASKSADKIVTDFTIFATRLSSDFPKAKLLFLAIKPSSARWNLWPKMKQANGFVENFCKTSNKCTFVDVASPLLNQTGNPNPELFAPDGLHLNAAGYNVWNKTLTAHGI